jgi:hypothetical protein
MSVLGQLTYNYLHKPILSPIKANGGLAGYVKTIIGKRQMHKKATTLRIADFKQLNTKVTVVGVAGKANWYQMVFCLYSFYNNLGFNLKTVIIDDGTIDDELTKKIHSQVPFATIISHNEAGLRANEFFNAGKYLVINSLLNVFVVFKKLFHAHALVEGPVLVLDADMLFYKKPHELIEWMNSPDKPVYMYDKSSIYGLNSEVILKKLPIKHNVNTGIIGLNNKNFDFEKLERLAKNYMEVDGLNYLIEQALYAMYLNDMETICLSPTNYEIIPPKNEAKKPMAVMHHYPTENRTFISGMHGGMSLINNEYF